MYSRDLSLLKLLKLFKLLLQILSFGKNDISLFNVWLLKQLKNKQL